MLNYGWFVQVTFPVSIMKYFIYLKVQIVPFGDWGKRRIASAWK